MTVATLRGVRFAPSPTGRFHVGNLRTAWISRELARALGEPWIVRFEDIDGPRVVAGAQALQLADLDALGLVPDEVQVQSELRPRHLSLFESARASGRVYPCFCSRKEVLIALEAAASAPHGQSPGYSGRCRARTGVPSGSQPASLAWRFRIDDESDPSGGQDFIVARTGPVDAMGEPDSAEFAPSYHWACAIDDHDGRYHVIVRAADLHHALAPQRAVQAWLSGFEGVSARHPAAFHASLVVQEDGSRLEKRTQGVTLPELEARGISASMLLEGFDASMDRSLFGVELKPGDISGESRSTIRLGELEIKALR